MNKVDQKYKIKNIIESVVNSPRMLIVKFHLVVNSW
jgi:hypothetical protein